MVMAHKKEVALKAFRDFKKKHPNLVIRCVYCSKAMSYINIKQDGMWRCPKCKQDFEFSKGKPARKLRDCSGKTRRKLSNDKIIKHLDLGVWLKSKYPNGVENYRFTSRKLRLIYRQLAFCATLYVTGRRISEIIGVNDEKGWIVKPFMRSQLIFSTEDDGTRIVTFKDLPILKTRPELIKQSDNVQVKNYPTMNLKLVYDYDNQIFPYLEKYVKDLDKIHSQDYVLFPFRRTTAYSYVIEVFDTKIYPHWLRHSRFTNITEDMQFNELMLKQFAGWTTTKMAASYVHLDENIMLDTMKSRIKRRELT